MTQSTETGNGALDLASVSSVSPEQTSISPTRRLAAGLERLSATNARAQDVGLLILRVTFGLALAFGHGLGKFSEPARFIGGLVKRGFPAPVFFGWAALLSEFAGALLLALGLLTRPAAALVLITLGVAAFYIHADHPFAKKELALAYTSVALVVLIAGPGRYSLDRRGRP